MRGGADASACCSCPRCSPSSSSSLRKGGAICAVSVNVVALRAPIGKHGADSIITVGELRPIPSQDARSSRVHGAWRPRRRTSTPCLTRSSWPRAGVRRPPPDRPPPRNPGENPQFARIAPLLSQHARATRTQTLTLPPTTLPGSPPPRAHDTHPYRLGTEFSHSNRHLGPHQRLGHKRCENNDQSI